MGVRVAVVSAVSEAQARQGWCPFGRTLAKAEKDYALALAACNLGPDKQGTLCLASNCMAWRWAGWDMPDLGTIAPAPRQQDRTGERLGYCGLAGKPWGAP